MIDKKTKLGQIIEGKVVENIYDKKRNEEIKRRIDDQNKRKKEKSD